MKYLKNNHTGEVFAFALDGSDDAYIGADLVAMSADEVKLHLKPAPSLPTEFNLCASIDAAADSARICVAGDPLRAIEYDRAAVEARTFTEADYPADAVPRTVAAWAINGRTPQMAAESILAEAAAYTEVLYKLREIRLGAKEAIRTHMEAGEHGKALAVVDSAVATIWATVTGIGNA